MVERTVCPDDGGACASRLEAAREGRRVPSGGGPDGACLRELTELTCAARL